MKLYLIDGYGFVFRAYHSLPPLTREDGTPIGCIYGFSNMLYKFLSNHDADYIAVVLDSGQKNFRHELYHEYKANRPAPPEDLIVQFPIIRDAINAFNVKVIEMNGYEADDLIAVYSKVGLEQGLEVKVISSDKDLMQLISEGLKLYDPIKNIDIAEEQVIAKLGIKPSQVVDYLALVGDSSDNIPGVAGIGSKTAIELLTRFESLDNIYNNIASIAKERQKNLLLEGKGSAYLSKDLVNLNRQYNIDCNLEELKVKELDKKKLIQFLQAQGFKSLVSRVDKEEANSYKSDKVISQQFIKIEKLAELRDLHEKIVREGKLAFYDNGQAVTLTIVNETFEMSYSESSRQEDMLDNTSYEMTFEQIALSLKEIFEVPYVKIILTNAKDLYKRLNKYGIKLKAFDDISLISYALETGKHSNEFADLIQIYLAGDVLVNSASLMQVYEKLEQQLFLERQFGVYENIDKPLSNVLAKMEIKGIKIDGAFLKNLSSEFQVRLSKLEREIYKEVGHEFLISSPKQLGEVLFVELSIKGGKKSKAGTFSTSAEILERLSDEGYDIADRVLEWRQFSKLINTYTDALPSAINPQTQRVHTTFMMVATNTGRLSSRDPNLQNIPIRTDEGQRIREAFVAEKGKLIISADYSQIELRLLAHIADITKLKEAFHANQDIHAITASQMFSVPVEKVDSHLRRKAKTINFGIIYGISAFGLAKRLDISQQEAKHYIDSYFIQYPGIKEYMEQTIKYARTHGYVKSLFGRKCYINGINDKNYNLRGFAERTAINAPLQSTSADIIKKAMVKLPEEIQQCMVLQIHDELLFEIDENLALEYSKSIKKIMEGVADLSVTLNVNTTIASSWGG